MNKIHRKLSIVLLLIAILAGCTPASSTPPPPAYWPTTGWRSAAPEEQGMDSALLAQMVEHIRQEKLDLHSLVIARNGYLVSELYGYPYSAEQSHWIASTTKSVIGALVGIAIQKGYIKDVRQPLLNLLPDQEAAKLDEAKKAITLEDFLTMTSGLDCHENPEPGEAVIQASPNWLQFMLDLPMAAQPGAEFNYCTGALQVLSAVLQKATGMSARDFANQNLFGPVGISPVDESNWPSDPQGLTIGGYGLALTPRDMAKLGYLFLNQGQWDGKTVLPGDWVVASTASHANQGAKKEYGYLWWIDPQGSWYAALGRAGQHIFVYPAENLVVVFTADLPFTNDADLVPLQELLDQYILPAVKSGDPLRANPDGLARLEEGIAALAQPQSTPPGPLPAIAKEISGKTYNLNENPLGWHSLSFSFPEGPDTLKITVDGAQELEIALDNVYRPIGAEDSPIEEQLRSRWEGQDTIVVEDIVLGQMVKLVYRLQFLEDALRITREEMYTGNTLEIEGALDPAAE